MHSRPIWRRHLAFAGCVGIAAAVVCALFARLSPDRLPDGQMTGGELFQTWYMARAIRAGLDPYAAGCPIIPPCADGVQYYPLTAGLVVLPLSMLVPAAACIAFVAISAALLTFGILRTGPWRIPMLLSAPFVAAISSGQWAPLLVAASLLPGLEWLYTAKPQLGAALFAWRPSWRAAIAGIVLVGISLAVFPGWPAGWLHAALHSPYVRSPLRWIWFAPVLLLSVLRWRTPEGRLLLAMAVLPQTPFVYDQLVLWLVPRTHRESLNLTWLSWAMLAAWMAFTFDWRTRVAVLTTQAPYVLVFLFLPCLVMVLRQPNEGELPAWMRRLVERGAGRWKRIRGHAPTSIP